MSCLRYISFHSTIADLGFYENKIWQIAHNYKFEYLFVGHFSPMLLIHAFTYQCISSTVTLLILQLTTIALAAIPLYCLSVRILKNNKISLIIVIIFFLFSAVEYNNLFDFGDNPKFEVEVVDFGTVDKSKDYPMSLESKGKAPEQYPDYDEE